MAKVATPQNSPEQQEEDNEEVCRCSCRKTSHRCWFLCVTSPLDFWMSIAEQTMSNQQPEDEPDLRGENDPRYHSEVSWLSLAAYPGGRARRTAAGGARRAEQRGGGGNYAMY